MYRRFFILCLMMALVGGGALLPGALRAQTLDAQQLMEELDGAGLQVIGTGQKFGIPYVEINFPRGMAVYTICRIVPSLSERFFEARDKIGVFNALNPFYVRGDNGEPFETQVRTLKIPLDFSREAEVFPAADRALETHDKYIVIDITKSYLALYERGTLARVFPISSGRNGTGLCRGPRLDFAIQYKDKNHWSSIYDVWMPWSLHMVGPYFIHGGVLPGVADSAGCIRMFPRDAEELFHLVDVGTPGRIVCVSEYAAAEAAPPASMAQLQ